MLQYKIREELPREAMAKMTPITYKSSDGLEIPGYLTLPKGVPAKNLPLVVNPHGGPLGERQLGIQRNLTIPSKSRLRSSPNELPWLNWLR